MNTKLLRNILIATALLAAVPAYAQTIGGQPDPVQYIMAPDTPAPHQTVTLTVQGVGSFLGDATITWTLNGVVAKQGVGVEDFTFTAGDLGQQSIVRLTIDSATQGLITHTFTVNPSTVDLVWEADTSVPPLYRGHALYSAGSPIKVVAFPTVIVSGKKVAAQSLSYQWTLNDNPAPASSGTGKSSFAFVGSQLNDSEDISLDVYFGSVKVAHGEVVVPASNTALVLYNKDALRGIVWDEALPGSIALNAKEISIFAQPYFFANSSVGNLSWAWALGGAAVSGPDSDQGFLTLRQTGSGQGSAALTVAAQNQSSSQLVQSAQAALSIVFGESANNSISSFFGL